MDNLDCIVSLTSWKKRINKPLTSKAIFSLINQKTKYKYKIILTLSKEEFPNRYNDLPNKIKLMHDENYIDILWADNNYKALKKLYPVYNLYDCPIMTTDDDIICKPGVIERFMNEHIKTPNMVLSESGIKKNNLFLTGKFRLFPKNSILNISPEYFKTCFKNIEDDMYIAVLMQYKNTPLRYIRSRLVKEIQPKKKDTTALRNVYKKINVNECIDCLKNQLKNDGII